MPHTSEQLRRVLILAGSEQAPPELVAPLREQAEFVIARSADEAAALLREGAFDLVLGLPDQVQPLMKTRDAGQILRDVGQPALIIDREGNLIWNNAHFATYPGEVSAALQKACQAFFDAPPEAAPLREQVPVSREYCFDLTATPLRDANGKISQMVGLAWDTSARARLQAKLDAIDNAGRSLISLDADTLAEMDVPDRLEALQERIEVACHELLHFDHFAVLLLDEKTGRLDTLLASGLSEADELGIQASTEGNGISGYVAATGVPYICRDVRTDSRYLPGLENARSCLAVPLSLQDRTIGVLNVESDKVGAFTSDDLQFAGMFARYVAMSLHMLQLLVVERHTTTGQIAADVDAESATPLNTILTDVAAIMEDFATDNPELRKRLEAIIQDVDDVKDAIHAATEPAPVRGTLGVEDARDCFLSGARILVADDEDIIRETISDVLTSVGGNVTMARDGVEAIRMLQASRYDLVLSDIKMPNADGYQVFAAARERDEECPVILITGFGYDPDHNIVRASREGLAGVLFKPFKVDQLLDQIRAAVASHQAGDAPAE